MSVGVPRVGLGRVARANDNDHHSFDALITEMRRRAFLTSPLYPLREAYKREPGGVLRLRARPHHVYLQMVAFDAVCTDAERKILHRRRSRLVRAFYALDNVPPQDLVARLALTLA